ncbi:hypothetical protein ACO22_07504 [Paracoccidioides brasiliensis]|uniref:Uncharacterized protein n=1 Tax=Paracoccidioides brasiliensis TaxID=121759 RepID=A0A1D2J4H6_PARBR|nr:hypothetical protein ACO22_07504 [Paracoccidioides brasiliensis]
MERKRKGKKRERREDKSIVARECQSLLIDDTEAAPDFDICDIRWRMQQQVRALTKSDRWGPQIGTDSCQESPIEASLSFLVSLPLRCW